MILIQGRDGNVVQKLGAFIVDYLSLNLADLNWLREQSTSIRYLWGWHIIFWFIFLQNILLDNETLELIALPPCLNEVVLTFHLKMLKQTETKNIFKWVCDPKLKIPFLFVDLFCPKTLKSLSQGGRFSLWCTKTRIHKWKENCFY